MADMIKFAADIGGTFTDAVLDVGGTLTTTKVLTNYTAPEEGILEGLATVCERAGVAPDRITHVVHGTTLATNALIERRGAKTAFITTKGFRDVIEMRTESRFEQYDLDLLLPPPLLARNHRYVVDERLAADGSVLRPIDSSDVETVIDLIVSRGYESVAVGLLHAYADDRHERAIRDALAARAPDIAVSLSSEVSPQMREYERFNTVVANAYVKPMMAQYLARLGERIGDAGVTCPIYLMHSGGGLMSLADAAAFPVRLVESGPAGGAIFAAHLAEQFGITHALSFDMGGTTAKICLIKDHTPRTARVFEVARSYRFKKGSGMPISIPVIDMVEIGAGGGSLAHVDRMGQIRVGPESAGSEPGPACYDRGGKKPAVTDADLMLGRLDPQAFAGGTIPLSAQAASDALIDVVGMPQGINEGMNNGMDAITAALGVSEVVDENMANAARVHAVENGEDLASFSMIAFGGAAPLHAARLCEKLGIDRLLIPAGAGVGSAIGFLKAPASFEATRSRYMRLSSFDTVAMCSVLTSLREEATGFVEACALGADVTCRYRVFMRYVGQGWEIPVDLDDEDVTTPDAVRLKTHFEDTYRDLFSRNVDGLDIEVTVWSAIAATQIRTPSRVTPPELSGTATPAGTRRLIDPVTGEATQANVFPRHDLDIGARADGPAVITEDETTIVIPAGFAACRWPDGTLELTRERCSASSKEVSA
ncbi:MAG: hydantoinase/oxoprolinase family protein [Pseudomonadota bacterium]